MKILRLLVPFVFLIASAAYADGTGMPVQTFKIAYDASLDTFVTAADSPYVGATVLPVQELSALRFEKLKADHAESPWSCLLKGSFVTIAGAKVLSVYEYYGCNH